MNKDLKIVVLFCLVAGLAVAASAVERKVDFRPSRVPGTFRSVSINPVDVTNGVLRTSRLAPVEMPRVEGLSCGDRLAVRLFDNVERTVELVERTPSRLGGKTFLGSVEGYDGALNAVVIETSDGLQLDIQDCSSNRVYTVYSSSSGAVVSELVPGGHPHVCGERLMPPASVSAAATSVPAPVTTTVSSSPVYVDLMVAYDTLAADWARTNGGGITNFAETAVQKMNTAIANTGLTEYYRYRLVGVYAAPGNAGGSTAGVLNSFAKNGTLNGYDWSELEAVRQSCYADIVCVLVDNGISYGTTGQGFSLEEGNVAAFSAIACNACLIRAVNEGHTMTHEVGHNMGAGHSDAMADKDNCGPQYYEYSSGYYFTAGGTSYYTIMAYNTDGYGNYYTSVPYFSSPDYTFKDVPVGDATHDNTQTLRRNFAVVADFCKEPVAANDVGAATGASDYAWTTCGAFPWSVDTSSSADGVSSARSCEMAGANVSWMETKVVGPATLSFSLRLRTYCGSFTVTCDGVTVYSCGDSSTALYGYTWDEVSSIAIGAGTHIVRFAYAHSGAGYTSGGNGAWVDSIVFAGGYAPAPDPDTYRITFDACGGTPAPSSKLLMKDAAYGTLPTVARAGYTFDGWYTARTGGTEATATTTATGDAILYAHWTAIRYGITYVLNGGTNASENPDSYTADDSFTLSAPTRDGYLFMGWSPNGGVVAEGTTGDKTFTAAWLAEDGALEFDAEGGTKQSQAFALAAGKVRFDRSTIPDWITSVGLCINGVPQLTWSAGPYINTVTVPAYDGYTIEVTVVPNDGAERRWSFVFTTEDGDEVATVLVRQLAAETPPGVVGDSGAVVTGDAANGYTISPSAGTTAVEVEIPSGVSPDKVTVEVSTSVKTVKAHGATIKVVSGGHDITAYLTDLTPDAQGVVDLAAAAVKAEVVKEALDPTKGADITLNTASPSLTTSATKPGLTYTLFEGATLDVMGPGDQKAGDGQPWTPTITVKGGASGFYSIGVGK